MVGEEPFNRRLRFRLVRSDGDLWFDQSQSIAVLPPVNVLLATLKTGVPGTAREGQSEHVFLGTETGWQFRVQFAGVLLVVQRVHRPLALR